MLSQYTERNSKCESRHKWLVRPKVYCLCCQNSVVRTSQMCTLNYFYVLKTALFLTKATGIYTWTSHKGFLFFSMFLSAIFFWHSDNSYSNWCLTALWFWFAFLWQLIKLNFFQKHVGCFLLENIHNICTYLIIVL